MMDGLLGPRFDYFGADNVLVGASSSFLSSGYLAFYGFVYVSLLRLAIRLVP